MGLLPVYQSKSKKRDTTMHYFSKATDYWPANSAEMNGPGQWNKSTNRHQK